MRSEENARKSPDSGRFEPLEEHCRPALSCRIAYLALVFGVPLIVGSSLEPQAITVAAALFVVLAAVGYRLAFVSLRVDERGFGYGFRGVRNLVPWERVKSVSAESYPFTRYWGWGYRIGGWRDRAYSVVGPTSGVRLRFSDERGRDWSIHLSSRDPDAFVRAANRKIP